MVITERLVHSAGRLEQLIALEELVGGRNNRVFRVVANSPPPMFLKIYFSDPRDPRQRLAAKRSFFNYAWRKGHRVRNLALLDHLLQSCGINHRSEARPTRTEVQTPTKAVPY